MELRSLDANACASRQRSAEGSGNALHVTFTRVMGGYIKGTHFCGAPSSAAGCVVLFGAIGIPNYAALGGIMTC